jgi:hypothetical protein
MVHQSFAWKIKEIEQDRPDVLILNILLLTFLQKEYLSHQLYKA